TIARCSDFRLEMVRPRGILLSIARWQFGRSCLTRGSTVGMASAMNPSIRRSAAARGAIAVICTCGALVTSQVAVAAKKDKTQVELSVKPASAQLFIDGKAMGKAAAGRVIDVTPGFHVIRLVFKRDEHEERIKFPPNQKTTYTFEFEDEAPSPD